MLSYKYGLSLSYSRHDEDSARWLHRALEHYVVPTRLVGNPTPCGPAPGRLRPIFRDRADVPAGGELQSSIEQALAIFAHLIVICSPSAVESTWVAEEINYFWGLHGGARILTVIAAGSPPDKNLCFPKALRQRARANDTTDRWEPIAADLRPRGDARRLVRLRIVAGMLGVGLDELVRRDDHRRRRRLIAVTAASLVGTALTAVLAIAALFARNEAERQRAHAEGLIEFMLTDLRRRLEPSGKLDLMDGVAVEALKYYKAQNLRDLDDQSLSRRTRALRLMGEIDPTRDLDHARTAFQQAVSSTSELVARSPHDTTSFSITHRIFFGLVRSPDNAAISGAPRLHFLSIVAWQRALSASIQAMTTGWPRSSTHKAPLGSCSSSKAGATRRLAPLSRH